MNKFKNKLKNCFLVWLTKEKPRKGFLLSDYEKLRYEIRIGDVLLVEGRSKVSRIIKFMTQSVWSHSILYIGKFHDLENDEIKLKVLEEYPNIGNAELVIESLIDRGTVITPLSYYRDHHIRICRPIGVLPSDVKSIIQFTLSKLGTLYDTKNIFDLARLLFPWHFFPRRWLLRLFRKRATQSIKVICSSLIAQAFDSVDFPILPLIKINTNGNGEEYELVKRNPHLFTPSDFDYSPFFAIIKYPMIDTLSPNGGGYHGLPWNKQGLLANDENEFFIVNPKNKMEY